MNSEPTKKFKSEDIPINDLAVLTNALSDGLDPNYMSPDGTSILHIACLLDNPSAVKILLQNGALVNKTTKVRGETPLHVAVEKGSLEIVKVLLAGGADGNAKNALGWTPLRDAINRAMECTPLRDNHAQYEIVQYLARQGYYIDVKSIIDLLFYMDDSLRNVLLNYYPLDMREKTIEHVLQNRVRVERLMYCHSLEQFLYEISKVHILRIITRDLLLARELCPESPLHRHRFPLDLLKFIFALCEMPFSPKKFV